MLTPQIFDPKFREMLPFELMFDPKLLKLDPRFETILGVSSEADPTRWEDLQMSTGSPDPIGITGGADPLAIADPMSPSTTKEPTAIDGEIFEPTSEDSLFPINYIITIFETYNFLN